ncbi:RcnB family protein, partial [Acetobacter oeni]
GGGGNFRGGGGPHGGMWRAGDHYNGGGVFVDNWRGYRGLYAPPPGYRWIDYGGSFLLAAVTSGIISSVIASTAYPATTGYPAATPYGAYPAAPAQYPVAPTPYPAAPGY